MFVTPPSLLLDHKALAWTWHEVKFILLHIQDIYDIICCFVVFQSAESAKSLFKTKLMFRKTGTASLPVWTFYMKRSCY